MVCADHLPGSWTKLQKTSPKSFSVLKYFLSFSNPWNLEVEDPKSLHL